MMQVPIIAATALAIVNLWQAAYRRTKTPSRDAKQTRQNEWPVDEFILFVLYKHVVWTWNIVRSDLSAGSFRCPAVGGSLEVRRGPY
jgi:hypothetical protein